MPVDSPHLQYEQKADTWRTMRDVIAGHQAIQKAGDRYLPKLGGHDNTEQGNKEYRAYLNRATFFNATARVVDALTGMILRKDPSIKTPSGLKDVLDDITLGGKPFSQFCEQVIEEVMAVNRVGVLVDFPSGEGLDGKVVTLDLAQRMGLRVYAAMYRAEDVINWRTTRVGGKTVLSLVVLRECVHEVDPADVFKIKEKLRYRVLELEGSFYKQTVWEALSGANNTQVWTKISELFPLQNGKKLAEIPFEFFSAAGNDTDVADPVLLDLAVVNLAHYRNTADLEHGLHFTGLPTAWVAGVDTKDSYRIGSGTAWVFKSEKARAEYLEFKGEGLKQLSDAVKDKEQQMAALGARMLAPEKKAAETSDTVAQKRQGETSSLAALAHSVSRGLTRVLQWMAGWHNVSGEVNVVLNTDFNVVMLSPQAITALLQAVVTGNISTQSFYEAMVKGEAISGTRTFEEEQALIAEDAARRGAANDDEPPPGRQAA